MALYAILKALGVGPGDEVILPAYTCVVVPSAILHLGAVPVYADIEPDTYTLSAVTVAPLITPRTRVIIAQNTYGLSADLDPLMRLAESRGVFVVEDAAHGLGSYYRGQPAGSVAHAAFFSLQWSKPISTGLGGFAYATDPELARMIGSIVANMSSYPFAASLALVGQQLVRPIADLPSLHYPLVDAYRTLTQRLGWLAGSSHKNELESTQMPAGYRRRMGQFQQYAFAMQLRRLPSIIERRQAAAVEFDTLLQERGFRPPVRPAYADHGMLRYAFRVSNKRQVLEVARALRVPIGDWFSSPLHPVCTYLERWNYRRGQCPRAESSL